MNWIDRILTKFKINNHSKFLIEDSNQILSSSQVLAYLEEKGIKYKFADSLSKLSYLTSSNENIIVFAENIDIPNIQKKKFSFIKVNFHTLPFKISEQVFEMISAEEYCKLAEYVTSSDYKSIVNLDNYRDLINQKNKKDYLIQRKQIIKKISKLLTNDFDYNILLEVGNKVGFLQYNDYKYKIEPFKLRADFRSEIRSYILSEEYKNVFFELSDPPKTVDKIIPYIKSKTDQKVALICFDCMGMSEWNLLKDVLSEFTFIEYQAFALVPTITSISRKAIFGASNKEVYLNNKSEKTLFSDCFDDTQDVCLFPSSKSISEDSILGYKIIGRLYNFFDDIAHSIVYSGQDNSKNRYFENILLYLRDSSIINELNLLYSKGYKLYICSDHGNVFASGNGTKIDKWLIEKSATRSYIVEQSDIITDIPYDKYSIPFVKNKYAILADEDKMFNHKNSKGLVHGGISLPEIVVPFIEVK